jgi:hypothetical protein
MHEVDFPVQKYVISDSPAYPTFEGVTRAAFAKMPGASQRRSVVKKYLSLALLFVPAAALADAEAPGTVVTTPTPGAAASAAFGVLIASSTSRNATGQIIWTCTYKVAAVNKTVTFRNGCPGKLKFEMTHR